MLLAGTLNRTGDSTCVSVCVRLNVENILTDAAYEVFSRINNNILLFVIFTI